jgi:hypothetical protein
MIRAKEIVALGISLRTVYERARKLGISGLPGKPLRFTKAEVRQILNYKPKRAGRKGK